LAPTGAWPGGHEHPAARHHRAGTSLASSKIVLTFPSRADFGLNTLLTPDGTRIVTVTPQGITEFSARAGQPILCEDQFSAAQFRPTARRRWTCSPCCGQAQAARRWSSRARGPACRAS